MSRPRSIPIWILAPCLLVIVVVWNFKDALHEVMFTQHNKAGHVASIQSHGVQKRKSKKLYKYVEPSIAGDGSFKAEIRRYNLFMSKQGVICHNIRHFGGMYFKSKDPPEYDPDGLWYVCLDPEANLVPGSCVVYSVGINNEWSFDDAIANHGCNVFAFDPTMNQNDHFRSPKIQFFNVGLLDVDSEGDPEKSGRSGWKTRTLAKIVKELRHENRLVDVLKIDIEMDEWKCLPQMLADGSLRKYVKQLDIEFHVVSQTAEGVRRYYGIVQWLNRQGFKIANMHKNMYCPQCYETTFINTNLIKLPIR